MRIAIKMSLMKLWSRTMMQKTLSSMKLVQMRRIQLKIVSLKEQPKLQRRLSNQSRRKAHQFCIRAWVLLQDSRLWRLTTDHQLRSQRLGRRERLLPMTILIMLSQTWYRPTLQTTMGTNSHRVKLSSLDSHLYLLRQQLLLMSKLSMINSQWLGMRNTRSMRSIWSIRVRERRLGGFKYWYWWQRVITQVLPSMQRRCLSLESMLNFDQILNIGKR